MEGKPKIEPPSFLYKFKVGNFRMKDFSYSSVTRNLCLLFNLSR